MKQAKSKMTAVAAVAALVLSACSSAPGPGVTGDTDDVLPLSISVFPNSVEVLMVSVAEGAGIFEDNGLDVEQVPLTGGPALVTSLLSGSVDIATAVNGIVWPVMKKGQEITALTGNARGWFNLIGQADLSVGDNKGKGDLSQLQNIKGMRVGVSALGSAQQIAIQVMLADAGLPMDWVTWVPVGGVATAVTAFNENQIDLLSTIPPELELIGEDNFQMVVDMAYHDKFNVLLDYYGAKTSWVKENPEKMERFCTSIAQAHNFMVDSANEDAILPILEDTLGIDDEQTLRDIYDAYIEVTFSPIITEDEWNRMDLWEENTDNAGFVPDFESSVSSECQQIVLEEKGK